MNTKNISACIVSREAIDPRILDSLNRFGFNEVLIGDGIANGVYGRYEAASRAKHDLIYTQDDDFLVFTPDRLFQNWDGKFVAHHDTHYNLLYRTPFTTVGYGAIFQRDVVLRALDFYEKHFGRDAYFYRECDVIVTGLCGPTRAGFCGAPRTDKLRPCKIGVNLPNAIDASRLHNQPEHKAFWNEREKIRKLAKIYTEGTSGTANNS